MLERRTNSPDLTLFFVTLLLVVFGIVMVYSASAIFAEQQLSKEHWYFLKKQFIWSLLGLVSLFIFSKIDYRYWQKYARFLLLITIIFLVLVLFIGKSVGGAHRWLHFKGLNFQPSELAKLVTILFLADYFDRKRSRINNFKKGLLVPFIFLGIISGLVFLEPDFGTALFIAGISLIMFFLAGVKMRYLIGTLSAGVVLCVLGVKGAGYRWARIVSFLNSILDVEKASYQTKQALYALGSGGLKGVGLGASRLKLLYLPEAHTDFIFPILGEELGLIGTLSLLFLYVIFVWRGWRISYRAPTFFAHLFASGITFYIIAQAAFNIAVSCGCLPTKGLPLPFLSFGGSALLCELTAVGILLNISRQITHTRRGSVNR